MYHFKVLTTAPGMLLVPGRCACEGVWAQLCLTLLVALSIIIIPTQSFRIPHSLCLKNGLPLLCIQF